MRDGEGRRREVTAGEMFGIAVGASVCLVLRGDRDEEEDEESGGEKTE